MKLGSLQVDDRGFAAAHCGKAQPFRGANYLDLGEAVPRPGGVASYLLLNPALGKAEPCRYVLRQSRKAILLVAVLLLLILLTNWTSNIKAVSVNPQEGLEMATQDGDRIRAPELSGARGWLNTDKPLTLSALKGKVVLLDFWTYGCINCMHIIPDLKRLERKYPNELVAIGVDYAEFAHA